MLHQKLDRIIRGARRLRGNTDADKKMLDAVEEAAKVSLRKLESLTSFRFHMSRLVIETDGSLFRFMFLWFLKGSGIDCIDGDVETLKRKQIGEFKLKELVDVAEQRLELTDTAMRVLRSDLFLKPQGEAGFNSYQEVEDQYKERLRTKFPAILRELAFLKEDSGKLPGSDFECIELKLPDPEAVDMTELARALQDEQNGLTMLCTPKPSLTHLENFRIALLHARLWLLRSELPVCFGSSVTYKDLRSGAFESMIEERAKEHYPSLTESDHMQYTVSKHSSLQPTQEVYHIKEEDYLPSSRFNTPGYPIIVTRGQKERSFGFLSWRQGLMEDEDVEEVLRAFERQETSRVLAQLRKFNPKSFAQFSCD